MCTLHKFCRRWVPGPAITAMKLTGNRPFRVMVDHGAGLSKKCGESADTFLGRMEAQCSHIRRYRREVMRREGPAAQLR